MKITLEMLGAMRKPLGQGPVEVDVSDGTAIRQFMSEMLGYDPAQVDLLSYYVNGEKARPSAILTPGAHLKILMIIGGG